MARTVRIAAKARITLCREGLEHLDAKPGHRLDVSRSPGGRLELSRRRGRQVSSIFGMLAGSGTEALSAGEIGESASRGWAGEK